MLIYSILFIYITHIIWANFICTVINIMYCSYDKQELLYGYSACKEFTPYFFDIWPEYLVIF